MNPRLPMTPEDKQALDDARQRWNEAAAEYKRTVVHMRSRYSERVTAKAAGLSTQTVQRWVREAQQN